MKTFVLTVAVLLFAHGATQADTNASYQLSRPFLAEISTPASLPDATNSNSSAAIQAMTNDSSSHFAQLTIFKTLPIPSSLVFILVALLVVGMRLMGLRQARTMARHERHSHHGKAEMFRALHAERSSRH